MSIESEGFQIQLIVESVEPGIYLKIEGSNAYDRLENIKELVSSKFVDISIYPQVEDKAVDLLDDADIEIEYYKFIKPDNPMVHHTDCNVRITHKLTKTLVHCEMSRSRHKNFVEAKRILASKLAFEELQKGV